MTLRKSLHLIRTFFVLLTLAVGARAAEVALDLAGKQVGFGSKILVNSGAQRLPASRVYEYELTGSVKGTGALADLIPSGTTFQQLASMVDANTVIPLSGTAENPTGKLPFGVIDQSFSGPITVPNFPVSFTASFRLKGSVQANGSVQYELSIGSLPLGLPSPGKIELEAGSKLTVRSLFESLTGQYHGLIHSDPFTVGREGHARINLSLGGLVTGSVWIGAKTYTIKSSLQADRTTPEIALGTSGLKVQFSNDVALPGQFKIVLLGAAVPLGEGALKRARYLDGPPLSRTGAYTILLQPPVLGMDDTAATRPAGHGYLTAKIGVTGAVTYIGKLCDGRVIAGTSAVVGADDEIPVFLSFLAAQGVVSGNLTVLPEGEDDDLGGTLRWVKPGTTTEKALKTAFDVDLKAIGSRYYKPSPNQRALALTLGTWEFTDGKLATTLSAPVLLDQLNRLLPQSASGVKATLNLTTGGFTGTFKPAANRPPVAFQGVILQKQNLGGGYFIGLPVQGDPAETGAVTLGGQN
jgi:hypothetical protein